MSEIHLETPQSMQTRIIDKLLQWDRIGNFRAGVIEAQSDLHRGLLRNPREVEIKLAGLGLVSRKRTRNHCDPI